MRATIAAAAVLAGIAAVFFLQAAPTAPRVIDGDTFDQGNTRVRLWGVDAPEMDEPGGPEAAEMLRRMTSAETRCEIEGRDRYGRAVMRCTVDLGCAMIAAGHAREWTRYSGGAFARCR